MSEPQKSDTDVDLIDRHVNQLAEHFDTVQIFVTRSEGDRDQTRCINRGAGNYCARAGQIAEWLVYENEKTRIACREREERP
jgi:hypothetical protein